MERSDLWYGTSGPPSAKIVLVAESWGAEEAANERPLVGESGVEANRMLAEAGYQRDDILVTNVVSERPYGNDMWRFFHPVDSPGPRGYIGGLDPGDNVRDDVTRLYRQLAAFPRQLVIAAGAYSLWALSDCHGVERVREGHHHYIPRELQPHGPTGITSWRGSMWYVLNSRLEKRGYSSTPLLPIIHPAAIMRQWSWRSVTVHDLRTRIRMALRSDWRHPITPIFWAPPTFEQAITKLRMWLALADAGQTITLAEDIETSFIGIGLRKIVCVGLADSTLFAMCIPFVRKNPDGSFESYWTPEQEAQITLLLRRVNRHPQIRIVGQNFIYDTQFFQEYFGVTPVLEFDTMLAQNTLFPGTPKALEYLSSLYCHYHWYWKDDGKEWDTTGTLEDQLIYNCWDCVRTYEVAAVQRDVIEKSGLQEPWRIKMRTNDLCLRMMNQGIRIDTKRRTELSFELSDAMARIRDEILRIVPQNIADPEYPESKHRALFCKDGRPRKNGKYAYWITSDKQAKVVLNEVLGLPVIKDRKTKQPTSGKEARQEWEKMNTIWQPLLERLALFGSAENTYHVINMKLDHDGKARCSFNPGGTETHRLSSSKNVFDGGTNLMNLTKGQEDD